MASRNHHDPHGAGTPGNVTMEDVILDAIWTTRARLIALESDITSGQPEAIHQARVACRRLRSNLKIYAPWCTPGWVDPTRELLGWYGHELGAARDLDVMRQRLDDAGEHLGLNGKLAGIAESLEVERQAAYRLAVASLQDDRYQQLQTRLSEAVAHPPLQPAARNTSAKVLKKAIQHHWRKLRQRVEQLEAGSAQPTTAIHSIRIQAKRTRYAADADQTPEARAFAHQIARIQDVLGNYHDATVLADWLSMPRRKAAFFAGRVTQHELEAAVALLNDFDNIWDEVSRKHWRKFLH